MGKLIEFGHPLDVGYMAEFLVTHEDIARITSTSRQSVISLLIDFKKRGLIDYDNRRVTVLNFQHS